MTNPEIPVESPETKYDQKSDKKKGKKKAKEVTFARPVFSNELFTDESRQKFDDLPQWQRHLIKRLVDHGDLKRASREAGVSRYVSENVDQKLAEQQSIKEALSQGGITPDKLVDALSDCLQADSVRFDNHGNPIQFVDLKLKLQTVNLICQLRGDFKEKPEDTKDKGKGIVELFEDTKVDEQSS